MERVSIGDLVEVRRLETADLDAFIALRDGSFGYPPGEEVRRRLEARLATTFGAYVGDTLAASLGDYPFDVFMAGRPTRLIGIAAVQTLPQYRRRGLAATLMLHALEAARDGGVGWSALYPFDPRFYTRYGWQGLLTGVRLEMPLDSLPRSPLPDDVVPVSGDLRAALQDLRLRCMRSWSFANARTRGPWDVWDDLLPEPGKRGLAFRSDHAYAVVQQEWERDGDGSRLIVIDAAYDGSRGREALLGILNAFRGQSHLVVLDLPADDALVWDWSSWYPARRRSTYMARVVDVPAALGSLRAVRVGAEGGAGGGGGEAHSVGVGRDEHLDLPPFTMRVRDDFAPWNDGSFRVTPSPDGCVVESTTEVTACTVDVRGLSLLAAGAAGAEAVRRAGLAEGDAGALATLAALSGSVTPFNAAADGF